MSGAWRPMFAEELSVLLCFFFKHKCISDPRGCPQQKNKRANNAHGLSRPERLTSPCPWRKTLGPQSRGVCPEHVQRRFPQTSRISWKHGDLVFCCHTSPSPESPGLRLRCEAPGFGASSCCRGALGTAGGLQAGAATWKAVGRVLRRSKPGRACDPAVPLPGVCPERKHPSEEIPAPLRSPQRCSLQPGRGVTRGPSAAAWRKGGLGHASARFSGRDSQRSAQRHGWTWGPL